MARPVVDLPLDAEDYKRKFYQLEGFCTKCGKGEHTLVIYEVVENRKNPGANIYRFLCLYCGHKDMVYSKEISIVGDDGPSDSPKEPPPELA